ncbi:MAG: putative Fe-S cluster protein YjdI [Granulosicoccus sp.]
MSSGINCKLQSKQIKMGKEYSKGDLTVIWDHTKCIHAAKCVGGLPNVFKPNEKPWINLETASEEELKSTIDQCPSGALTHRNAGSNAEVNVASVGCNVSKNGPLLVKGDVTVVHADGREEQRTKMTAFCRCGKSGSQPYCDGTHAKIGFEG